MGSSIMLGGLFLFTEPLKLPLIVLFVPFVLFFVWVRSLVLLVLRHIYKSASVRKRKAIASSIAIVWVLVVILQSLGQLSWRDIVIVISLMGILGFYFNKTDLI